ncbi:MAG: hypothetical protein JXA25_07430 [Anaerolineales bacterium]|nr:hypothetical protein [Anaerolineales bacterium]
MSDQELPDDIRNLYKSLLNDIILSHTRWEIFKELYTHSDERMVLLSETAPGFFRFLRDMLVDDAIMIITRLLETKRSRDSLKRLLILSQNYCQEKVYKEWESGLESIVQSEHYLKILEHRNRRVAHRALKYSDLNEDLPIITRKAIENTLEDIGKWFNQISGYLFKNENVFTAFYKGDPDTLVYFLDLGRKLDKLYMEIKKNQTS